MSRAWEQAAGSSDHAALTSALRPDQFLEWNSGAVVTAKEGMH